MNGSASSIVSLFAMGDLNQDKPKRLAVQLSDSWQIRGHFSKGNSDDNAKPNPDREITFEEADPLTVG